ncbi:methylphosphotriester-DNA--protein-cysteine methyltransferase [Dysgonomonadaceae bacterium PH5-43]|nr:methylphosphotriester-DNA--protein-cysteine methyltransferase [Dysgonomonadaceae bacterium PH5-43]
MLRDLYFINKSKFATMEVLILKRSVDICIRHREDNVREKIPQLKESKCVKFKFVDKKSNAIDSIDELLLRINTCCGDEFNIKEEHRNSGMCGTLFRVKFKERTGCSFVEYLKFVRAYNVGYLLLNSSLSINDIMIMCGFKTDSNFRKFMQKMYGMSAREFRKKQSGRNI